MPRARRLPLVVAAVLAFATVPAAVPQSLPPQVTANSFTVQEDQTWNDTVGRFETFFPSNATFTVTINWGDG